MTNIDIYAILSSIPHNPHFLKRYFNFINSLNVKQSVSSTDYLEKHHICPKSLFPEYADLSANPWNSAHLSGRVHIMCHIMLWKAYGGKMTFALDCMLNKFNGNTNYFLEGRIPSAKHIRLLEALRKDLYLVKSKIRKGKSVYKDKDNNKYFLSVDDPLIQELNLVGNNLGMRMTEESKEKFRRAKDDYRTVTLYKSETYESVSVLLKDKLEYINNGWKEYKDDLWFETSKRNQSVGSSEALTGTMYYYYPDGTYYGKRLPKDSPLIAELGLLQTRSEKQKAQASSNALKNAKDPEVQRKKSLKMSRNIWCYDPVTKQNTRCEVVPEGWKVGKYGDAASKGSTTWNDGLRNYMVKAGELPEPHWVRGMRPRTR